MLLDSHGSHKDQRYRVKIRFFLLTLKEEKKDFFFHYPTNGFKNHRIFDLWKNYL